MMVHFNKRHRVTDYTRTHQSHIQALPMRGRAVSPRQSVALFVTADSEFMRSTRGATKVMRAYGVGVLDTENPAATSFPRKGVIEQCCTQASEMKGPSWRGRKA